MNVINLMHLIINTVFIAFAAYHCFILHLLINVIVANQMANITSTVQSTVIKSITDSMNLINIPKTLERPQPSCDVW